jgi:hypothetical protein
MRRTVEVAGGPERLEVGVPIYADGAGVAHSAVPVFEYVKNLGSVSRQSDGTLGA